MAWRLLYTIHKIYSILSTFYDYISIVVRAEQSARQRVSETVSICTFYTRVSQIFNVFTFLRMYEATFTD